MSFGAIANRNCCHKYGIWSLWTNSMHFSVAFDLFPLVEFCTSSNSKRTSKEGLLSMDKANSLFIKLSK